MLLFNRIKYNYFWLFINIYVYIYTEKNHLELQVVVSFRPWYCIYCITYNKLCYFSMFIIPQESVLSVIRLKTLSKWACKWVSRVLENLWELLLLIFLRLTVDYVIFVKFPLSKLLQSPDQINQKEPIFLARKK